LFNVIYKILKTHEQKLLSSNQRMAVIFHATQKQDELTGFIDDLWHNRKLIISPVLSDALVPERASNKLGEEYDLVVFDARDSLSPDALGIISGVLCGGGQMIILLPEKKAWLNSNSLFTRHVNALLNNQPGIVYLTNTDLIEKIPDIEQSNDEVSTHKFAQNILPYRTEDQKHAVENILHAIQANNEYCCVLTSGRGRGKSSSLGFVAAQCLAGDGVNLFISAPRLSVADPVFEHLGNQCPQGVSSRSVFKYKNATLKFIAPDLLLETLPPADILFIDEAAAIPLSMLERLLAYYPKIIFSTTTHGYEGTGRGFVLKFFRLLDKLKPGWDKIELQQPIRWSIQDPLEAWIENVLFLNLKIDLKPELPVDGLHCRVNLINRENLLLHKNKLSAIFSLLVVAHYRTSPADFQYLLDSEDIRIYSLEYKNQVLGVLVINQEGGFDSELSTAIYRGLRRPRGSLLAQTLCFHGGSEKAAQLNYARVMRIAIHPQLQHAGLGSYLLEQVILKELSRGMDVFGSSFSATAPLLDFWSNAGLSIMRLGFSRDHVTASHSAVMAKALSAKGDKIVHNLHMKFQANIDLWLQGPLAELSDELKQHDLLHLPDEKVDGINSYDLDDVESFSDFNRNYDACMPAITRLLNNTLLMADNKDLLAEDELKILKLSLLYMNNWITISNEMNNIGKAQAIKLLRSAIQHLLKIKN
jgi:tRNA(Met) cytidine acetyltransferase